MCGCVWRKNRPWHNIRYQTPVIDIEKGCALDWVVMNLLPDLQACGSERFTTQVLMLCQPLREEWIPNEVLMTDFITCLPSVISCSPFIYQKDFFFFLFWSYRLLQRPLVWSGDKVTHTCGNSALWTPTGSGTKSSRERERKWEFPKEEEKKKKKKLESSWFPWLVCFVSQIGIAKEVNPSAINSHNLESTLKQEYHLICDAPHTST